MIHKTEILNILKDQKRGKGSKSGFDLALLTLGAGLKSFSKKKQMRKV
jgi:hypothetical protein